MTMPMRDVTPPARIRYLQPGEPVPTGAPRRYKASSGYIRLRWNVGPGQLVECWEHRLVMGFPNGHVHHINRIKDDNRPENLEVLSADEHRRRHAGEPRQSNGGLIDFCRGSELYEQGLSLPAVARELGCHHVALMRAMKRHGYPVRDVKDAGALRRHVLDMDAVEYLMRNGVSDRRIAKAFGMNHIVMRLRRADLGIAPLREGRVTNAEAERMDSLIAEVLG